MKKISVIIVLVISVGLFSCNKSRDEIDREVIENYIQTHKLQAVEHESSGMFYVIKNKGSEKHPDFYSTVVVDYDGYLIDDSKFDSGDKVKFSLENVITGWQMGIPLIGEGGSIKLIIPSNLAYGSKQIGSIPSNSVLIFDVDLLGIQ